MTDTLTKCCATCVNFRRWEDSGLGWCAHPERQPLTDVTVSVRPRELPCRISWEVDSWSAAPERPLRVADVLIWGPFPEDASPDDFPGDLIGFLLFLGDPEK